MSTRMCRICNTEQANDVFGRHIDDHSDAELAQWPGGMSALGRELEASMAESEANYKRAAALVQYFLAKGKRLRTDIINYLRANDIDNPNWVAVQLIHAGVMNIVIDDPVHDHDHDDDAEVITAADEPDLSAEGDYLALPGYE